MKVLFLDIDGVLNGYNFWLHIGWNLAFRFNIVSWCKKHIKIARDIHEKKVKLLSEIIKQTNCKIVMSSSWRHGWNTTPYDKLPNDFKQLYDLFDKYKIEVMDITPTDIGGNRSKEILSWLSKHKDQIESFVILDDECSDLDCFICQGRLVQTSSIKGDQIIKGHWKENTGLKKKHVKLAVQILNKRKWYNL